MPAKARPARTAQIKPVWSDVHPFKPRCAHAFGSTRAKASPPSRAAARLPVICAPCHERQHKHTIMGAGSGRVELVIVCHGGEGAHTSLRMRMRRTPHCGGHVLDAAACSGLHKVFLVAHGGANL